MTCFRISLLATVALAALLDPIPARAQAPGQSPVTCQVLEANGEVVLRIHVMGASRNEGNLSAVVLGRGPGGYARLGVVPLSMQTDGAAFAEVSLESFGVESVTGCSATIVPANARPKPVDLSPRAIRDQRADRKPRQRDVTRPAFLAPEPLPPLDPHSEAQDGLRHVAGPVIGFGLGVGLAVVGAGIGSNFDSGEHYFIGPGAFFGGYLGFALGTGLGTAWVWNAGETEGALGGAVGGSMLGGLLGMGLAVASQSEGGAMLALIGPGIGAWIGAARGHRHPAKDDETPFSWRRARASPWACPNWSCRLNPAVPGARCP